MHDEQEGLLPECSGWTRELLGAEPVHLPVRRPHVAGRRRRVCGRAVGGPVGARTASWFWYALRVWRWRRSVCLLLDLALERTHGLCMCSGPDVVCVL